MTAEKRDPLFPEHRDCETLAGLMLEHLPRDGSVGRERHYNKGANVWLPQDRADSLYFLRRGQISVMRGDAEHREVILRVIDEGEPFGELCFCSARGGVRHTTARAVVESEVVEVPLNDFLRFLRQNREALLELIVTFCIRLADAERRVEVLAYRGAEDRLGRLLLQLAASRGEPSEAGEGEKILHVSHEELAHMAALSRPHVTVTMGKFRKRGLVQYARDRPLVVDVPALEDALQKGA